MLLKELEKPRIEQVITVDHVIETTKGVEALLKRDILDRKDEDRLRKEILHKFRTKIIKNTVAPRQLAKIARAVERRDVSIGRARQVVQKLISEPNFGIDEAFSALAKRAESVHHMEQLVERTIAALQEYAYPPQDMPPRLKELLEMLQKTLRQVLKG
jgi:Asp-tRNA(Asn)/Glu-tRNA(Gln) amidotransferase B subunit